MIPVTGFLTGTYIYLLEVKLCRGRQRKTWRKVICESLLQLNLGCQEILAEDYNVNLFLERVDEPLRYREYKDFIDGLNSKVKLSLYKSFCKEIKLLAGGWGSRNTIVV